MLFFIFKRLTAILIFLTTSLGSAFSSDYSNIDNFQTGNTPIIDAVSSKDYKSLEFFVKISPQSVNNQNIGGATALHIAARNNDQKSTQILLTARANPNLKDIEGYSAPLRACEYNNKEVFNLVAIKNKINFALKNNEGDGFITISTLAQSYNCLTTALKNIIPLRDISIIDLKRDLKNAFIIAVAKNDEESKSILLKYLDNLYRFERTLGQVEQRNYIRSKVDKVVDERPSASKTETNINKKFILKSGSKGVIIEGDNDYKNRERNKDTSIEKKKRKKIASYFLKKDNNKLKSYSRYNSNVKRNDSDLLIEETIIID